MIDFKVGIKEAYSKDKRYGVILYQEINTPKRLSEWTAQQDVKLLTLDGSYGGVSGKSFVDLTTDADAQDDWHIGKKYDAQSYVRVKTVLYKDTNDKTFIRISNNKEKHNSYLVVSKQHIRNMSGNLLRAKTSIIEGIANAMVETYIKGFNCVSLGEYYTLHFIEVRSDGMWTYDVPSICGKVDESLFGYVMANCPYTNSDYEELVRKVLSNNE